ncbi:MAG: BON domain-containing protein [Caldilineaceae bacterium]
MNTTPAGDEETVVHPSFENARYWTGYYSAFVQQPVIPTLHHHIPVGIPSNMESIGRRMLVRNRSGIVGRIDHLLVAQENWTITHLVVRRGIFPYDLIIPMDWVEAVEDAVFIKGDNEQLRLLPLYRPRPVPEVLEELQQRFDAAQPDFSHVVTSLEEGVLQLEGGVMDEAESAEAEHIGRSLSGVVAVDNRLQTNGALLASVSKALLVDPRTCNEVIEVHNDRGVIALHGVVTSGAVRKSAVEIAARQKGVISVVNALEVKVEKNG